MIAAQIEGGDEVIERLQSFPDRLAVRLSGVMQMLGLELQERASEKLGGAVLQRRSGKLAAGLTLDLDTGQDETTMTVGVNSSVRYAAYQEYGFHGTETVRAHLRVIKEVFGRPIAARTVAVKAYTRRVNYPAHSFLRSALADIAPDVEAQIEDAVQAEIDA
jgi:hypothetical protein